jgi:hypothetical protein
MSEIDDPALEEAIAFLRGNLTGLFRFEGDVRPVKIIVAPDGTLVMPAMVAMLRSLDTTLYLPDEEESSMHLHVSLQEFQEAGPQAALCDRWRIYHGDPPDVRWGLLTVDAARYDGLFIDGEALHRANPLAAIEPALCKRLNTERTNDIRAACRIRNEIVIEAPKVVGVDPYGFDVRGAFDIIRLESPIVLTREKDVMQALDELMAE